MSDVPEHWDKDIKYSLPIGNEPESLEGGHDHSGSFVDFVNDVVKPAVSDDTTVTFVVDQKLLAKAVRKYSKTFQVPEDVANLKLQNNPQLLDEWLKK